MKVLGIDPGFDRLGIALLDNESGRERLIHSECFETNRADVLNTRLLALGRRIDALMREHSPDAIGIETLFFNKNQKTAIGVAQARGIIIYLAELYGSVVYEFGPQEIKIAVTGYGKSDKKAVIAMIRRLVPESPEDALDDEYDAIAVGITCLAHQGRSQ